MDSPYYNTIFKIVKRRRTHKEPLRLSKPLSEGLLSRVGGFERRPDLAKQGSTAMSRRMSAVKFLMFFIILRVEQ